MSNLKQRMTHDDFVRIRDAAPADAAYVTGLVDRAVAEVTAVVRGRDVGYCWSGGKDSQALEIVMNAAGILDCCLGMTQLEYRQFLVWVTDHMPAGLQVFNNGWDLAWLARHQDMLFPHDARTASRWFVGVHRYAQQHFAARMGFDLLITGQRKADGNFIARSGIYEGPDGVDRYAPLRHWTHADIFAILAYYRVTDQAPFYGWPRGYRVGTHSWPARQWCQDADHGFAEVFSIEPDRVRDAAAAGIRQAARWLERSGNG